MIYDSKGAKISQTVFSGAFLGLVKTNSHELSLVKKSIKGKDFDDFFLSWNLNMKYKVALTLLALTCTVDRNLAEVSFENIVKLKIFRGINFFLSFRNKMKFSIVNQNVLVWIFWIPWTHQVGLENWKNLKISN